MWMGGRGTAAKETRGRAKRMSIQILNGKASLINDDDDDEVSPQTSSGYHIRERGFRCCCWGAVPRLIIHPDWMIKDLWDIMILSFVLYNAVTLPLYLGFVFEPPAAVSRFEIVVDVLFIVDMVLSFRTAYYDRGNLITDPKRIMTVYARSWLVIDVLAVFPMELLAAGDANVKILTAVKCIRLLRLGRFFKKMESWKSLDMAKVVILFFTFALLAHWVACFWALINYFDPQWYEEAGMLDEPLSKRYLLTLYTALLMLIGDNVNPTNNSNTLYAFLMLLLGSLFYSVIFGNMSLLISNLDRGSLAYRKKMDQVNLDIENLSLKEELADRIRRYFQSMWMHNQSAFLNFSVMEEVPEGLKVDILVHQSKTTLCKVPFFQNCEIEFIIAVATKLMRQLYLTGDMVFVLGDAGDTMFFIDTGCIKIFNPELDLEYTRLGKGTYMGEVALMTGDARNASAVAVEPSMLSRLMKTDFEAVCEFFPNQAKVVREEALVKRQLLQKKNTTIEDKRMSLEPGSRLSIDDPTEGDSVIAPAATTNSMLASLWSPKKHSKELKGLPPKKGSKSLLVIQEKGLRSTRSDTGKAATDVKEAEQADGQVKMGAWDLQGKDSITSPTPSGSLIRSLLGAAVPEAAATSSSPRSSPPKPKAAMKKNLKNMLKKAAIQVAKRPTGPSSGSDEIVKRLNENIDALQARESRMQEKLGRITALLRTHLSKRGDPNAVKAMVVADENAEAEAGAAAAPSAAAPSGAAPSAAAPSGAAPSIDDVCHVQA